MKEAIRLSGEYLPVPTSTFCAVPVFPPTRNPLTRAWVPVPSSWTTLPRISRICSEVFGDRTRRSSRGSPRYTVLPSGPRISRTRRAS